MPKPRIVEPEYQSDNPFVDPLFKIKYLREERDRKIAALNNFKALNEQGKPQYATLLMATSVLFNNTKIQTKAEEIVIAQNQLNALIEEEKDNIEIEFVNKTGRECK